MPRSPRLDAPGSIHHVMVRGIERQAIFRSARDCLELLDRLDRVVPETGTRCLAWALIPNHFHLVVESRGELSRLMSRVGTGYALAFNRRHHRVGHVFQNRFKSRLVLDEADLVGVIRYVTANPVRHKLVTPSELHGFPWSSYRALLGETSPRPFEAVAATRLHLGQGQPATRRDIERLVQGGSSGDPDLEPAEKEAPHDAPPARRRPSAIDRDELNVLVSRVCSDLRIDPAALRRGTRRAPAAAARAAISYLAVVELGISGPAVAAALNVDPSAVYKALDRGRQGCEDTLGVGFVQQFIERPR